ncbi:hypothetical protein TMatcc_007376 [Talaromyces marneffei ATCC 18224]|uniref:MARVEL domain-containing protein n=2 Tax=Talaromyces marneffei TaxID=37727 RepID=B6QFQ6_TALMQ|nr:uncharacterized protein EYB26_004339 [Talaromyces marneffei]EEA24291.1 hypothetical protein PMAA_082950 [Talaromyces marneffei ATCC 18224]KAE8553198.1 hypothetical protein EYB25_004580 [Talaromyces marneffei]QGA16672.1 hypothetical protein EYB26_004339 [Talaromyces marneffei]
MHLNEQPPSYAQAANTPPPAYVHKTDNDNSNTEFIETSSHHRLDFDVLNSFMNSGGHRASYNDNNRNNMQPAPRRSESWFDRMFQVNTRGYHTFSKVDTQMGSWGLVCIAIQCVTAAVLLCVSGVAIKLYQNPWNQSQVIGGETLSYALAGSILSCVTGSLALCFAFFVYLNPIWGLVFHTILTLMYAGSSALLGYGSYITRNNNVCINQDTGTEIHDCYNIRLSAGWRCGMVVIALCAINVITPLIYSLKWVITWLAVRNKRSSRDVNQVV